MNAVEIEEAISQLADQPFDPANFPYAFLEAFGNKETTIKRLRAGASNKSDLGGVLQTSNIHIKVCAEGEVTKTLAALRESPSTTRGKAKFILATDGLTLEAENLASDDSPVACNYKDFPDHFGFFLPLAGISTVRQISENSFDIRATSRLNRLYVELLKDNPEWGTSARRHDMNHFMARLIFCFFAEDTDIFIGKGLFTDTIAQMSARDSSNTNTVIETLFRAMNTKIADRDRDGLPRWSNSFPYVNGGLFSGNMDVPRFSKIARSYLLHIGNLDWTKINPDIFGSMIQAVAEDEERGELGMHYTSVPNILKVLNPLFLDELRAKLAEAGDNPRTLLNLRKRIAKIRVFDPACGSGNFLVIAYKAMREIEAEINKRRGELEIRSEIPLTNYRGIELRDFPAEIARLALVIAEYQCDVLYRGQKLALAEFLPLRSENWITCGNALRLPVDKMDEIKLAKIQQGQFFIVGGQIAYVAEVGQDFRTEYDRRDSRLHVVYDNGTESNLLARSFQRSLYPDKDNAGRIITDSSAGPLFADEHDADDLASGTIYVLRSKSDNPLVAANRDVLHKIGVTGGKVETRLANASLDPTFLLADVEVVATYVLYNVNRVKLENLIHRVFDPAQLDIEIKDRFGNPVKPREWFLVPLFIVDEAVARIKDGTITEYVYDPMTARLLKDRS